MDVITEMLDYDYIDQCNDVNLLRAIYENLLRNELGNFPHLERAVKKKLSALLTSENEDVDVASQLQEEVNREKLDLQSWIELSSSDSNSNADLVGANDISHPPIRKMHQVELGAKDQVQEVELTTSPSIKPVFRKENMSTREYFEAWEKFDPDSDEENVSEEERSVAKLLLETSAKDETELTQLQERLDNNRFTAAERTFMSEREKMKGNELFQIGQIEESMQCYTKSILLDATNAKSFANRALAKMKSSPPDFHGALDDCTSALDIDPAYIKALVRRGMVRDELGQFDSAVIDYEAANKLDGNDSYNRLAQRSRDKSKECREKVLCRETTTLKIVEVEGIGEDELINEEDFDYMEEIYTPGAVESMLPADDNTADKASASAPKLHSSFAQNLKKLFSSSSSKTAADKSSAQAPKSDGNTATVSSENWCKVEIISDDEDEFPSSSMHETIGEGEDASFSSLKSKGKGNDKTSNKSSNRDSQSLCF